MLVTNWSKEGIQVPKKYLSSPKKELPNSAVAAAMRRLLGTLLPGTAQQGSNFGLRDQSMFIAHPECSGFKALQSRFLCLCSQVPTALHPMVFTIHIIPTSLVPFLQTMFVS